MVSVLADVDQFSPHAIDTTPVNLWLRGIAGSGGSKGDFQATLYAYSHATEYAVKVKNPDTTALTGGRGFQVLKSGGTNLASFEDAGVTYGVGLTLGGHLLFSPDATYDIGAAGATRPRDVFMSRDLTVGRNTGMVGTLAVNGAATLGDANADAHTAIGTLTVRNVTPATLAYLDAPNRRAIFGAGTALGSATDDLVSVVGGALHIASTSAATPALLQGWRFGTAGTTYGLWIDATPNPSLIWKDDGGTETVRFGDAASTYQLQVTGDFNVTDDSVLAGDLTASGAVLFNGATFSVSSASITLGDAAGDAITVTGTPTFAQTPVFSSNIDVQSGTAGEIRVGAVIVNAAALTSTEKLKVSGNVLIDGSARRILADWSNATVGNRTFFQTSTANSNSVVGVITAGSGTTSILAAYNSSDPATGTVGFLSATATAVTLTSTPITGATLPLRLVVNGTTRIEADGTGLGFFAQPPVARPDVSGSRGGNAALADLLSELANLGLITDSSTA